MMHQEFDSAGTSVNQIASIYKLKNIFKKGDRVLDYGGGKYDTATEFMAKKGVSVQVYDPFNRTPEHNRMVLKRFMNKAPDVIVCANVLNVIKEPEIIVDIVQNIKRLAGRNTKVLISVYERDKTGIGVRTDKGWQRNERAEEYGKFILPYFTFAFRKGNVWYC